METKIQKVVCHRCNTTMYEEEVTLKRVLPTRKSKRLCDNCLSKANKIHSEIITKINKTENQCNRVSDRMKSNNPMYKKEARDKVSNTLKEKYEKGLLISPFTKKDVREKAREKRLATLKEKYEKGLLISPFTKKDVREKAREKRLATLKEKYEKGLLISPITKKEIRVAKKGIREAKKAALEEDRALKLIKREAKKAALEEDRALKLIKREENKANRYMEWTKDASDRMKTNNPMYKNEIREKMSATFRENIKIGKICYKRGPEHHLWKGNRSFNFLCRSRLSSSGWVNKVMSRDSYCCVLCEKTGKLHVHHIKPLREIIREVALEQDIYTLNDEEKSLLADKVVEAHKLEYGITVCPKCHALIDSRYRRKNENC